jgi:hypothetical protein
MFVSRLNIDMKVTSMMGTRGAGNVYSVYGSVYVHSGNNDEDGA